MNLAVLSKADLRREALARRSALDESSRDRAAIAAAHHALGLMEPGALVALYAPVRGELDPGPLAERLAAARHALALPVVEGPGLPLSFRRWNPGQPLESGYARIPQPPPAEPAVLPDIVFVPLAAFDARGHRLGYGAGFYDRTLAALRARKSIRAYGLGFAVQQIACVPAEAHDVPLDGVVTENGFIRWES